MEWVIGIVALAWLIHRETKARCHICHSRRKFKHLRAAAVGVYFCDGGCNHVAFITGKPVMVNGQMEVIYNWER
jgi:hypothetical protein